MNEVLTAVKSGLEDLSVSRPSSRLSWGVPVPGDSSQTIYVWLDALLNYASAAGYPWTPGTERRGGWPADLQVIGKDIIRFHCIYWPAFLMALNLELPNQILAHAHWTLGKEKMAKSTGNVVNPFFAIDRFGLDAMRFYLAYDGGVQQDSDYGNERIAKRYRKALHGGLGNLTSRVLRGKGWNVRDTIERMHKQTMASDEIMTSHLELLEGAAKAFEDAFDALDASRALKEIMKVVYSVSQEFNLLGTHQMVNITSLEDKRDVDAHRALEA